jgi:pimeloyl-ACP methyl ester carboxylesterase
MSGRLAPQGTASPLARLLLEAALDPDRFEALLHAWNEEIDPEAGRPGPEGLTEAADSALAALSVPDGRGNRFGDLIAHFSQPTFLVGRRGEVQAMNAESYRRTDMPLGAPVDDLPWALDGAEPLSAAVARLLVPRNAPPEIVVRRAVERETGRAVTLALLPVSAGADASALLFAIESARGGGPGERLMSRAYDLTAAETEILSAFLDGAGLDEIAARRGRSLATVRTRMRELMAKTDARSQPELTRLALSQGEFARTVEAAADEAGHPHRRRASILAPSGCLTGRPLVFLSTMTRHLLPASVEARLAAAGLLALHVGRPGFGGTDAVPEGGDPVAMLAADLAGLLAQLGASRAPVAAFDAAAHDAVRLAGQAPAQVSEVVLLSPALPPEYLRRYRSGAPWAEAMLRVSRARPTAFRTLLRTGIRAWTLLGSRRFARIRLSRLASDLAQTGEAAVMVELDRSVREAVRQGIDATARDLAVSMSDWSDAIRACPVPIRVVQGCDDPVVDPRAVRDLARDMPDRVSSTPIAGAGCLALQSHPDAVIAALAEAPGPATGRGRRVAEGGRRGRPGLDGPGQGGARRVRAGPATGEAPGPRRPRPLPPPGRGDRDGP